MHRSKCIINKVNADKSHNHAYWSQKITTERETPICLFNYFDLSVNDESFAKESHVRGSTF